MVRARLPWSAGKRLTTAASDEEEWRLRTQASARPSLRALNLVTADEWTEWSTRLLALTHKRPADADLNDPSHEPPLDISSDQVRRYEEAVMAGLRNQLGSVPGRSVSQVVVHRSRPDTRVVVHYRDLTEDKAFTWTFELWGSGYPDPMRSTRAH